MLSKESIKIKIVKNGFSIYILECRVLAMYVVKKN
jgi:hypothetical protein